MGVYYLLIFVTEAVLCKLYLTRITLAKPYKLLIRFVVNTSWLLKVKSLNVMRKPLTATCQQVKLKCKLRILKC
ncbi:hypothetical protein D3C78_1736530 [compost metagenome]